MKRITWSNRENYRQSRAISVLVGRWRSLSRAVSGYVETWRAVAVSIRGGTQNPALFEHTSSSLVPGISPVYKGLGRWRVLSSGRTLRVEPTRIPTTDVEIAVEQLFREGQARRVAQLLAIKKIDRDRLQLAINIALKSGTAAKVLG